MERAPMSGMEREGLDPADLLSKISERKTEALNDAWAMNLALDKGEFVGEKRQQLLESAWKSAQGVLDIVEPALKQLPADHALARRLREEEQLANNIKARTLQLGYVPLSARRTGNV